MQRMQESTARPIEMDSTYESLRHASVALLIMV